MTIMHFLRTLEQRINKSNGNIGIKPENFIDSRYLSPLTNPFLNNKQKTIIWIEKK